ncbi:MAG TPA: YfiR family protein [Thermoanaerobaculia bacterium]
MEALRRRAIALLLLALAALHAGSAPRGELAAGEYQIKAAFLHHFAQFVDWPPNVVGPGAPLIIGLVGDDPFGRAIDEVVAGKRANGHPIVIRHMRWNDSFGSVQMLFVSTSELQHLEAILDATRGFSVLTVSDFEGFTERGGIIELVTVDHRVRFDINPSAAAEAHLKISSKLLQVARSIRDTVEVR